MECNQLKKKRKKIHIDTPLKISKKMRPNFFITPGIVFHLDKHICETFNNFEETLFVIDSYVCVNI